MVHIVAGFTLLTIALPLVGAETRVGPGESIQAAVDHAASGDRITVLPGTYHETGRPCPTMPSQICAVVVSLDNITLTARGLPGLPVILENRGGQSTGIAFAKHGANGAQCQNDPRQRLNGARVEGFIVRNFRQDGISLFCADNWSVRFNTAVDNAEYGIFPAHCGHGRLSMNTASGSHDTGIYIGQSHDVQVDHNVAHDNVDGYEVENSVNIELDHNVAFHNTAGIVMFILPGRDILQNHGNQIHDNFVFENNSPNTCLDPAEDVCLVPPGIGILAVGGDHNRIDHNQVGGNQSFGIGLTDVCTALRMAPNACRGFGFDPLPKSTHIEFNTALDNGANPQFPGFPGADLIWSALGTGNCWRDNLAKVIFPRPLPACDGESPEDGKR